MAKRDLSSLFMASTFRSFKVANKEKTHARRLNRLSKLGTCDIQSTAFITVSETTYNNRKVVNKDNIYTLYVRKVLDLFDKAIRVHRSKVIVKK